MAMPCSSSTTNHDVFLGLGSNLGRRAHNLHQACKLIEQRVGHVVRLSSFMETEPWGFESKRRFMNAVVRVETALTPRRLLEETQQIEREMGRTRKSVNGIYHDRIIDIDILLYDDLTVNEPDLLIPHPQMKQRPFVMEPLREILERSDSELLAET
jgi:2-amino-4-hydroxy-6-hydroxymethyldihydropteridine diphosphokinase